MFHKCFYGYFHRQGHLIVYACCCWCYLFREYAPRRQTGLYSSRQCTYPMWHLVKRDLCTSVMIMFSLHSERLLENFRKNLLRSFSPRDCPDQLRGDTRCLSNHFYYFPIIGILYCMLHWKTLTDTYYMPSTMLGMVLRSRLPESSRLVRYTSI